MAFKIITKLIASGLHKFIIPLIRENQYGFIKTRNIRDCLAWAFKYLDICHKSKKKFEIFMLKFDFEKAFDKMEFSATIYMLKYLEFGEKFVPWTNSILNSASISIILNCVHGKPIKCRKRGMQGAHCPPFICSSS
jgi:hypothetical protein